MAYLEIRTKNGNPVTKRFPLDQPSVSVGRSSSNRLVLRDTAVSRCHCIIETNTDGARVVDLDSRHGVRVNRKKRREAALADGDQIKVGPFVMTFRAVDLIPAAAATPTAGDDASGRRAEIARMRAELSALRAQSSARESRVAARLGKLGQRTEQLEAERLELMTRAERAEVEHRTLLDRFVTVQSSAKASARDFAEAVEAIRRLESRLVDEPDGAGMQSARRDLMTLQEQLVEAERREREINEQLRELRDKLEDPRPLSEPTAHNGHHSTGWTANGGQTNGFHENGEVSITAPLPDRDAALPIEEIFLGGRVPSERSAPPRLGLVPKLLGFVRPARES